MKMRTEGMASGQQDGIGKVTCHDYLLGKAFSHQARTGPPAPASGDITVEGDEVYTAWARTFPCESQGWTINFLEQLLPKASEYSRDYGYRKVWRQGLEVALD